LFLFEFQFRFGCFLFVPRFGFTALVWFMRSLPVACPHETVDKAMVRVAPVSEGLSLSVFCEDDTQAAVLVPGKGRTLVASGTLDVRGGKNKYQQK